MAVRGDGFRHDGEGEVELHERVETVSELLVATGSESINNESLEYYSRLLRSFNFSDLPDEPQPNDNSLECLVTVLENCRTADEDAFGDQILPLSLRPYPKTRSSSSRWRSKASPSSSVTSPTASMSPHPRENTELRLQEQFEKYKNSATKPRDGVSCSDTRPFSTSSVSAVPSKHPQSVTPVVSPSELQKASPESQSKKQSSPSKKRKSKDRKRRENLQDQFDKSYNKKTYPRIGPGHTDIMSEISDITMPKFSTSAPEENDGDKST